MQGFCRRNKFSGHLNGTETLKENKIYQRWHNTKYIKKVNKKRKSSKVNKTVVKSNKNKSIENKSNLNVNNINYEKTKLLKDASTQYSALNVKDVACQCNFDEVNDNDVFKVMSCNDAKNALPVIQVAFGEHSFPALLDTGANLSLIQQEVIDTIKNTIKVNYISRSVRIKTINNQSIPYLSAVDLKFKIQTKWFTNLFFTTNFNWNSSYKIILGYDFFHRNRIVLDTVNKRLITDKTQLEFSTTDGNQNDSVSRNLQKCNSLANIKSDNSRVKSVSNVTIEPNTFQIVKLKIPNEYKNKELIMFSPNECKNNFIINDSMHSSKENEFIYSIIENNSDKKVIIQKDQNLGTVKEIFSNDFVKPIETETLQINSLSLEEVWRLRKEELSADDFDLNHLDDNNKNKMLKLLLSNFEIFSKSYKTLGSTDVVTPEFNLIHNFPIQTKPYPIPNLAKKFAEQEIKKLLEAEIIEPSTSNYCFPIIFVKKKQNPSDVNKELKFRMVVDYRLLNCITEPYKICLPKISDVIHTIAGRKFYSVLDLKAAFFQIKLKPEDRSKLSFCCEIGNFQPLRLPFGSRNSTSYFHSVISKCLQNLKGPNLQYFLDDIIVAADSIDEMSNLLQQVFDRLKLFNLTLDPAKLQLCKTKITYLGFNLEQTGFSPSEANVNKVTNFPIPKNVKQVQTFLGMTNYFRHLIYDYANIVAPIVNLTKKGTTFFWSNDCQEAFDAIQDIILHKPTLKNFDPTKPIVLVTDASRGALSSILLQKVDNKLFPVEFFSKKLTSAESLYPSIRRELFAIYASIKHFREHLYGQHFTIHTDAEPLTKILELDKQPDIVRRWVIFLQDFNYKTEHIPGLENPADFLSRVYEDVTVNNLNIFQPKNDLSNKVILEHQQNDNELKSIIEKLNLNDQSTKENFKLNDNNILLKKINVKKKGRVKAIYRIFVPLSLRKACMENAHLPHFGAQKTFNFLQRLYFWPSMFSEVRRFCGSCHKCLANKAKPSKTLPKMITKSRLSPGQQLGIDIVGKLPRSIDNKFFILTVVDHYSRYLETFPLTNITSSQIIKCLNQYFASYGIPKIIISDNGPYFISNEIETFFKELHIEHNKSSIYYPCSNGTIERTHKIMKESIASLSDHTFNWSHSLLCFKLHYNASKHSVTQFSPAELFLGRKLDIPLDVFSDPTFTETYNEYHKKLTESIEADRNEVIENEQQYFKQHEVYLKGKKIKKFKLGDKVFIKNLNQSGALMPKYKGPYVIERTFRNDNYLVKNINDSNEKPTKLHVSKLYIAE